MFSSYGQRGSRGAARETASGPGFAKTRAFNLLVESSSQFGQSEKKVLATASEEGNREAGSTLSWLAHIFTRPGSTVVDLAVGCEWLGWVDPCL